MSQSLWSSAPFDRSAATLRTLMDAVFDGVIIAEQSGRILTCNQAAEKMFGCKRAELIGQWIGRWVDDERHVARRADGISFPIDLTVTEAPGDQKVTIHVVRDVTARIVDSELRYRGLQAERDAAIAANQAKTHFLAQMSHELRTPLNAIIGFSELIDHGIYGPVMPERYQEYIGHVLSSGRHLLSLIDDVLDIARIEAGKFELREEAVDLAEIVEFAVLAVERQRRPKQISISTTLSPTRPMLFADRRLCRQITANLLSNAIKFTPAGGQIGVSVADRDDGGLELAVADNGIGIDPVLLPRLGTYFVRVKDPVTNAEGTGIGLALTKKFAELHGGEVNIASEQGHGTRVAVWFPPSRCERGAALPAH
jgi:two-component system cell cycle sensor histidine kinase PleC